MEEEVYSKSYDGRLMRRMLFYMRPYRTYVVLSLLLLLLNSLLQVAAPLLTKLAVDRYMAPAAIPIATPVDAYFSPDPYIGLTQISVLYLAVILLTFLFDFAQTYVMNWTGQRAMFDLRRDLMHHLQQIDVAYYDANPVGRMVTRVTTDVDVLNEMFTSGLVTICGDLLMFAFVAVAMFQLSPGMTLLLLSVLPVVVFVTAIFRRSVMHSYRRIRVAIARINSYLQEHVNGIAVLQLFNRERKSRQEFEDINRIHMEAFKDSIFAYGWFYPVVEFLSILALAMLLSYGGYRVDRGELTLGVLVAFFQYGIRFFRPIQDLSEKYNILQSAMAAAERVFKLLDTAAQVKGPAMAKPFPAGPVGIEFDGVSFAYSGDNWVLQDVSFSIAPGETIAVVGHTGAGKTTLTSLLMRFYDVQQGGIRIGGTDIRDFEPRDLRKHFGVVLQDPYIFTGTIEENIRLGTEGISGERLLSAVEQVNLHDFIASLPSGFAQPVRERGDGLSTGQKQLINFARALAHNPRFLILDEATSSVDTETEFKVREALARMVEGRTSIIIAHRLSTIQRADRIFVMHKGRLRETGTHQELLAQRGIYWKLYQLQYKDQEGVAGNGRRPLAQPAPLVPE